MAASLSHTLALAPAASVAWSSVLVTHYQNSNIVIRRAIDNRVRENLQGITSSSSCSWCTEGRVSLQKRDNTFKFIKKTHCYRRPGSFKVKIDCIGNIAFRPWVERIAH
jgi:hypothetical protein